MQDRTDYPAVCDNLRLYSLNGVAMATSQSLGTIRNDMNSGRLRIVRKPDSTRVFVTPKDLAEYIRWITSGETSVEPQANAG